MSDSHFWRHRFIELAENLGRALGHPAAEMPDEPGDALVVTLNIDGSTFELVHEPEIDPDSFRLEFRLGPPPDDTTALAGVLQASLDLTRADGASFGWLRDENMVVYSMPVALEPTDSAALLEQLKTLASHASAWRAGDFFNNVWHEADTEPTPLR